MPKVINPACAIALNAYAESSTHQLLAGFAPNLNATLALNWGSAFVLPSSSAEATTSNRSNMPALSRPACRKSMGLDGGNCKLHAFAAQPTDKLHCTASGRNGIAVLIKKNLTGIVQNFFVEPPKPHSRWKKAAVSGRVFAFRRTSCMGLRQSPPLGKPLLQRMPCRHRIEQRSIAIENHRINHSISFPSMRGYVPQEPSAPAAAV